MVLPEFVLRLRNRLLTDSRFISFAQRFPLTRPVARSRSLQLFDLLAGFSYSQILYTCVSLRVFETVGVEGCSWTALEKATALPADRHGTLVKAAIALKLLERSKDDILLGPHGAALLAQPWISRFIEHHAHFYRDLQDPVGMLRKSESGGGLRQYWGYEAIDSDKGAYSALMAESQRAVSAQVLDSYDFRRHKRLLDVGGGTGAFLRAVGKSHPLLELNLFDLPEVLALPDSGAPSPIYRHAGDFRLGPLPQGMDIVSVVRVVHDHDDPAIEALFHNIRRSVAPGATVLIAEPFAGDPATARVTDAYFNFYFAAMGQGRTRSPREIAALAARAGFGQLRVWPTHMPLVCGVLSLQAI